jgi:hypothetical protein
MSKDTESEEFRHQCLVKYVIELRIKDRVKALTFINDWNESHKDSLESDVITQWKLGNRANKGEWK